MQQFWLCVFILFFSGSGQVFAANKHFVIVESQIQKNNLKEPWNTQNSELLLNLATYVGQGSFLTHSRAVDRAKFLTLQKVGGSQKYRATVVVHDKSLSLALVKIDTQYYKEQEFVDWMKDLQPIQFVEEIPNGSRVHVHRFGQNISLKQIETNILDISSTAIANGYVHVPHYRVDAAVVSNITQSEPLLMGRQFIGLANYIHNNSLYVIPASVIKDFIERSRKEIYQSIPFIGLRVRATMNPFERSKLGAAHVNLDKGVVVSDIYEESPFYTILRKDDLIVGVNGKSVSFKGEVKHSHWDYVTMGYDLLRKNIGDSIEVEIVRDGQVSKVHTKIARQVQSDHYLVPPYFKNPEENYLIVGGLVFQNLSREYLELWGNSWHQNAPVDLVRIAQTEGEAIIGNGDKKTIVMTHVLPLNDNKGFHSMSHMILDSVNDRQPTSVAHLREILQNHPLERNGESYMKFRFRYDGGIVVFSYKNVEEMRSKLVEAFALPSYTKVF